MTPRPISIRRPEIDALVAGTMSVMIRPIGKLADLPIGALLWVREPFYLPRRFAHLRPTAAAETPGCAPVFAADHSPAWFSVHGPGLGARRYARELPKAWHRQHLRIRSIERLPLHDVAEADMVEAGFKDRELFRIRWDEEVRFAIGVPDKANYFRANPEVLRIAFDRIDAPLPAADQTKKLEGASHGR